MSKTKGQYKCKQWFKGNVTEIKLNSSQLKEYEYICTP